MAIVMIYQTYNSYEPELLSLQPNFTDAQFVAFMEKLGAAIKRAQAGGYERHSVTMQVLTNEDGNWISKAAVEM